MMESPMAAVRKIRKPVSLLHSRRTLEPSTPSSLQLREIKEAVVNEHFTPSSPAQVSHNTFGCVAVDTSLELIPNGATLDENASRYKTNPELSTDKPFSSMRTTMNGDPSESRQALVLDPIPIRTNRNVFTDLPPEIRNMIYGYVMEEEKDGVYIIRMRGKTTIFGSSTSGICNILLVSKQVSEEAASMLYGCRLFLFHDAASLCFFLGMIGFRNRASVAHIALLNIAATEYFKSAAVLLRCLTGLRSFQVRFQNMYGPFPLRGPNVARFVKDFLPFFTAIEKTRGGKAFLNVINLFQAPECSDTSSPAYFNLKDNEIAEQNEDGTPGCNHRYCNTHRIISRRFKEELTKGGIECDASKN